MIRNISSHCFVQGAASFAKKTIFGLSDSVTKVTSSFGKGIVIGYALAFSMLFFDVAGRVKCCYS